MTTSQVKNLRAMFENKGDTSPPDERGRSLGVSTPSPTPAGLNGSPRPLSKVRTNFVAVEKDGVIGLRRDCSGESRSSSSQRLSSETDTGSTSASTHLNNLIMASIEDVTNHLGRLSVSDTPPGSPVAGAVSDKPSTNPDKKVDEEISTACLSPADPVTKLLDDEPSSNSEPTGGSTANGAHEAGQAKATAAPASSGTTAASKPAPVKPVASKAITEAPKKAATKPAPKPAERFAAVKKEASVAAETTAAGPKSKPGASATVKRPQPVKTTDNGTSLAKPKGKSPTKLAHLPSSLTAPAASSVSKPSGSGPRQSLSRQSLHPSPTAGTSASATKTVKRQSSSTGRSRPSLGFAPSKPSVQEPPKKFREVDEGFLARLMRPTQASSNKTHNKTPVTPPRKMAPRSSSTAAIDRSSHGAAKSPSPKALRKLASMASSVKESIAATAAVTEKAVSHAQKADAIQSSVKANDSKPDIKHEVEAVEEIITETTKVDTAEEAVELAQRANLNGTPVQSKEPENRPGSELAPAEKAAPEAANVETAEEIVAIAKEADLVHTPVEPEPSVSDIMVTEEPEKSIAIAQKPEAADSPIPGMSTLEAKEVGPTEHVEDNKAKMMGGFVEAATGSPLEGASESAAEKEKEYFAPNKAVKTGVTAKKSGRLNDISNGRATTGEAVHGGEAEKTSAEDAQ